VSLFDQSIRMRPARVLIGWLPEEDAILMQSGRRDDHPRREEFALRAHQARIVAAARRPDIDARGVVTELGPSLRKLRDDLEAKIGPDRLAPEGWRIGLVDLRRVCAVQPTVYIDTELPELDPGDLEAIAAITLRTDVDPRFDAQYHRERNAWIIPAGPDLKFVGEFQSVIEPGVTALGFTVRRYGSYLQAVRYQDRYVIRDGNHRAIALMQRGIHVVPALVTEAMSVEDIHLRRGMLPIDVVLGNRPPMLPDYFDSAVAAEVDLPMQRRVLVIQGLDLPIFS
jgi:hypothetical protein